MGCVGLPKEWRRNGVWRAGLTPPYGATTGGRGFVSTPPLLIRTRKKNKKMPIRYIDLSSRSSFPAHVARTRSDVAPSDAGCEALPKTSLNIGNAVTENASSVTENKRGRPRKADALTAAEKQRRYRQRLKDRAATG